MSSHDERMVDLESVYREYHAFVWRTLHHFGLRSDEISDAQQEVFVVVHRRMADFDGRTSIRNWLYGIARRVSSDQRKKHQRRVARLRLVPDPDALPDGRCPGAQASAASVVERFLGMLDEDKRQVFVLAEVEGMTAPEIAEVLRMNLNTVYARLRAARLRFQREIDRQRAVARRKASGR